MLLSLLSIVALYAATGVVVAKHAGRLSQFHLWQYSETVGLATLLVVMVFSIGRILWIMAVMRPDRLTAAIIADFRRWLDRRRLVAAFPVAVAFTIFISVFTSLKMLIPILHPFAWDPAFMELDRTVHFGMDPWRILHGVFGAPVILTGFNFVYNCWFFVMFGVLYWQLFSLSDPVRRMQFFHAFMLGWMIVGTMLATVFSSAGPCFYEGVTGDSHFAPLMTQLAEAGRSSPLWAPGTQAMLWRSYTETGIGLGTGISAMPSVHVATAFLFVLVAWQYGRMARALSLLFLLFIMIGSVLLGWHYAMDGYAAIPLMALIWWVSGRWVRFLSRSPVA